MDDTGLIADLFAGATMSRFAKSELVIEGYREPRVDQDGKPYIAVVAAAVAGKNQQAGRKLEQIRKEVGKAEEAFNATRDEYGKDSRQARTRSSIRPFSIARMAVLPSTRTASIRWAKRLSCVKPAL